MPDPYHIFPIGFIHKQQETVTIEILDAYLDGLLGIENFSHVIVFCWFHKNDLPGQRNILQVHPRGDDTNPLTGVFATRSPTRPNPIAISTCKLLNIQKNMIIIDSIDAFEGTPVIDIKPYIAGNDYVTESRIPPWVDH
ncbi:tRNA (N6-threonylcarbamoyladenosine(37)-N6)-methyltransferase TrmO [Thermodesulfobacteriota bacterium]